MEENATLPRLFHEHFLYGAAVMAAIRGPFVRVAWGAECCEFV
jgi:hypothetical protein